jgi:hypothetical protein
MAKKLVNFLDTEGVVTLRSMVARLNIEHFCKKLSEEINETKRRTLLQLVAEERAKLFVLLPSAVA